MSERDHTTDENAAEENAAKENAAEVDATEAADVETQATDVEPSSEPVDEPVDDAAVSDDVQGRAKSRWSVGSIVGAVLLTVALLGSAGMAGWLYLNEYRPDQETDAAASQVALDAAKTGTIALLSYSPESLDQDFANAKAKLTGDFLNYYTQFTEQIVTPAAREKSVKTAASVIRAAVSEIEPDNAEVLVFINQTTTSKENPDGAFAASSVKVGLTKIDGNWLIESFDPV